MLSKLFLTIGILFLMACSSSSESEKKDIVTFSMTSPSDMSAVQSSSPSFVFSRGASQKAAVACDEELLQEGHETILRILETGDASSAQEVLDNHHVFFSQKINLPDNCELTVEFKGLDLKENEGYAWYLTDESTGEASKLHRLIFAQQGIDVNFDPFFCEEKHIKEGSLLSKNDVGQWQQNTHQSDDEGPAVLNEDGHEDEMSLVLRQPHLVVYQKLRNPLAQGENYIVNFSVKAIEQGAGYQLKVLAFNHGFSGIEPNVDTAVIGMTGTLPQTDEWLRVSLDVWAAYENFDSIAFVVVPVNQEKMPVVLIDRVCVNQTEQSPCDSTNEDGTTTDTVDFDAPNVQGPVETELEYMLGSVQDLYPNQDTSTINWYQDGITNTNLACASVDNEEESQEEIDLLEEFEAEDGLFDDDAQLIEDSMPDVLAKTRDLFDETLPQITPIPEGSKKCSPSDKPPTRDPNKPFSGRDIVYIHGLQTNALKGNVTKPKEFQHKWPDDWEEFYKGGAFHKEATEKYWNRHIEYALGYNPASASGRPSNSYLVVTYSANQRLDIGIHAVLTQIRDAMGSLNDGVVKSKEAYKNDDCFGDNGIVVITHSTGGLLASSMFGLAEKSHVNPAVNGFYGDVRFIADKIDAQVGINAAYGGSDVATFALGLLAEVSSTPVLINALEDYLEVNPAGLVDLNIWYNSVLVDLVPSNASTKWRPWMESTIPTLTLVSAIAGKTEESGPLGKIQGITKGFDDAVLFPTSQANNVVKRPRFKVKNKKMLKDKSMGKKKRNRIIADTKKASGVGYRNYVMSPALGVTGMLQHQSVKAQVDLPNQNVANHHTVLQTTGDHLDTVNEVFRNGVYYGYAKEGDKNNEESSIVFNSALYSQGLLHADFGGLTREWVRKKTWGYHAPRVWFKDGKWWKPRVSWHYYERIKWKRHYHLLKDYDSKMGIDYMYDYVLRN